MGAGREPQLAIGLGLQVKELGIFAFQGQQVLVGALFENAALFDDEDTVGQAHGNAIQ